MQRHRPPHIYSDNTWYMLTASIYGRAPLLAAPTARILVRDALQTLLPTYGMGLRAWAILDDHYHLLLKTCKAKALAPNLWSTSYSRDAPKARP